MTSLEPTVADRREAMAVLSEICPLDPLTVGREFTSFLSVGPEDKSP